VTDLSPVEIDLKQVIAGNEKNARGMVSMVSIPGFGEIGCDGGESCWCCSCGGGC
jgi:hypothetical protein